MVSIYIFRKNYRNPSLEEGNGGGGRGEGFQCERGEDAGRLASGCKITDLERSRKRSERYLVTSGKLLEQATFQEAA